MNVESAQLLKLAGEIGKAIYQYSEELPEEEKWNIGARLRSSSSDAIAWSAEALGSIDPRDIKWALGKARANLSVVQATYKHACDVGLLVLNPDIMVRSKKAIEEIDSLVEQATVDIPAWFKEMNAPEKDDQR